MGSKLKLDPPPQTLEFDSVWKTWLHTFFTRVGKGPFMLRGYTVATAPIAAEWASTTTGEEFSSLIFVSDETGGATIAFSDGTNWRRVTDRAVIA